MDLLELTAESEAGAISESAVTPRISTNGELADLTEETLQVVQQKIHGQASAIASNAACPAGPAPIETVNSRMLQLTIVEELLGKNQKRPCPSFSQDQCYKIPAKLVPDTTESPLMSEDAENPNEKKTKKRRPGKAQWNNSYKNRLARRKAEREALAQQMSEVAVENKSLVPGEHQSGTPIVLESDIETISLLPNTLINDTLVDDVVSGVWQLIADYEQHDKNDQYHRNESKGCMIDPKVILEPTNKEITVKSELNAVPTVKRTSGKAQWNNSYKNRLTRRKEEREAQTETAGSCKSCHPQSYDVATQLEDVNPPLIPVAGTSVLSNISMTPGNDIAVAKILDLNDLDTHEKQHEVDSKLATFAPLTTLGDAPIDWEVWDSCSCFDNPIRRMNANFKMPTWTQPWM